MRRFLMLTALMSALTVVAACSGTTTEPQAPKVAPPSYPPAVAKAAQNLFGNEAEVISYGDLAKNGKQEALVVSRLKIRPETMQPGLLVTRAAIIEKAADSWDEVFLCDEHLKNPNGFLGGQPVGAVGGWRLQMETDPNVGLEMYFTPLEKPAGGYIQTYEVRWNPAVKRYETLDRNYKDFLKELPSLQPVDGEQQ